MSDVSYWDPGPGEPSKPKLNVLKIKVPNMQPHTSVPCTMCKKPFYHFGQLLQHSRCHSQKRPFKCRKCNKSFLQLSHLMKHRLVTHTGQKKCHKCGSLFPSNVAFIRHSLRMHGVKSLKLPKLKQTVKSGSVETLPPKAPIKLTIKNLKSVMSMQQDLEDLNRTAKKRKKHKKHKKEKKRKKERSEGSSKKSDNNVQTTDSKPRILLTLKVPKENSEDVRPPASVSTVSPSEAKAPATCTNNKTESFTELGQASSPKDSGIDECSPLHRHESDDSKFCANAGSAKCPDSTKQSKDTTATSVPTVAATSPCAPSSLTVVASSSSTTTTTSTLSPHRLTKGALIRDLMSARDSPSSTAPSTPDNQKSVEQFGKSRSSLYMKEEGCNSPHDSSHFSDCTVTPSPHQSFGSSFSVPSSPSVPSLSLVFSKTPSGKSDSYTSAFKSEFIPPSSPCNSISSGPVCTSSPRGTKRYLSPFRSSSLAEGNDAPRLLCPDTPRSTLRSLRQDAKSPKVRRMDSSDSASTPTRSHTPLHVDIGDDPYAFDDGPCSTSPQLRPYSSTLPRRADKYKLDPPVLEPQTMPSVGEVYSDGKNKTRPRLTKQVDWEKDWKRCTARPKGGKSPKAPKTLKDKKKEKAPVMTLEPCDESNFAMPTLTHNKYLAGGDNLLSASKDIEKVVNTSATSEKNIDQSVAMEPMKQRSYVSSGGEEPMPKLTAPEITGCQEPVSILQPRKKEDKIKVKDLPLPERKKEPTAEPVVEKMDTSNNETSNLCDNNVPTGTSNKTTSNLCHNHVATQSLSAAECNTVPSQLVSQSVPSQHVSQSVPYQPVSQPVPSQHVSHPVPSKPVSQSVPYQPVSQPVPYQPVSQPVPYQPVSQPVPSQHVSHPVPSQHVSHPVPSPPVSQSVPYESVSEPTTDHDRSCVDLSQTLLDVVTELSQNGLIEKVASENGLMDNVTSENGLIDNVASENGLMNNVASENGLMDNVASENGLMDNVASENGSMDNVASENGLMDNVASENGLMDNVASENGLRNLVTDHYNTLVAYENGMTYEVRSENGLIASVASENGLIKNASEDSLLENPTCEDFIEKNSSERLALKPSSQNSLETVASENSTRTFTPENSMRKEANYSFDTIVPQKLEVPKPTEQTSLCTESELDPVDQFINLVFPNDTSFDESFLALGNNDAHNDDASNKALFDDLDESASTSPIRINLPAEAGMEEMSFVIGSERDMSDGDDVDLESSRSSVPPVSAAPTSSLMASRPIAAASSAIARLAERQSSASETTDSEFADLHSTSSCERSPVKNKQKPPVTGFFDVFASFVNSGQQPAPSQYNNLGSSGYSSEYTKFLREKKSVPSDESIDLSVSDCEDASVSTEDKLRHLVPYYLKLDRLSETTWQMLHTVFPFVELPLHSCNENTVGVVIDQVIDILNDEEKSEGSKTLKKVQVAFCDNPIQCLATLRTKVCSLLVLMMPDLCLSASFSRTGDEVDKLVTEVLEANST